MNERKQLPEQGQRIYNQSIKKKILIKWTIWQADMYQWIGKQRN